MLTYYLDNLKLENKDIVSVEILQQKKFQLMEEFFHIYLCRFK